MPPLFRVSYLLRDWKLRYRGKRPIQHPIVVVDIDDASLDQIGRWPWRRDIIARLIERTFELGASVVGLDIVFSDPQESVPEELREVLEEKKLGSLLREFDFDAQLAELFDTRSHQLVSSWMSNAVCRPKFSDPQSCPVEDAQALGDLPQGFEKFSIASVAQPAGLRPNQSPLRNAVTVIPNLAQLDAVTKHSGFVNSVFDADGLIRHISPLMQVGGKLYPSLALQMAQLARGEKVQVRLKANGFIDELKWEKTQTPIPTSASGLWDINYLGPGRHFKYVSARDLFLADVGQGSRELASGLEETFKGAVVFIGVSALAVGDLIATPFDPVYPGVEAHATVAENLLSNTLLKSGSAASVGLVLVFMVLTGLGVMYLGQRWEAIPMIVAGFFLLLVGAGLDFQLLFGAGYDLNTGFWYLQILGSAVITITGRYIIEQNEKKFLRGAFSKYVAPAVVDRLVKDPKLLTLGGHREMLTILFSDVRGFTTLSEKLDAKRIGEFLNDYLGMQTEIAFQFGGTLDKYIGDALMAFWGAPLAQEDHAHRACQAAVAMAQCLEENRARYLSEYGIAVNMGIGLTTGEVSVGNMGSSRSFSYTVIGDTVNLASRLESATKQFGVEILTSRATLEAVEKSGRVPPPHRVLASTKVKGKTKAVEVVELLRLGPDTVFLQNFEKGRRCYERQEWGEAIRSFKTALTLAPTDACTQKYLKLCEALAVRKQPDPSWDPSWSLTDK